MKSTQYFNSIADQWDSIRQQLFPDSIRETAVHAAGDINGVTVADIGAGTGFLTEILLHKGARVIAVDQSEKMIRQLQNKFCCNPKMITRVGVDTMLPIDSNTVHFVFANMFLHHVENPKEAIKEMVRILRPGGKVIITDLDEHQYDFLVTEQHDRWMGFRRNDIESWFSEAGLSEIHINCTNAHCCSSSASGNAHASISTFIAVGTKTHFENTTFDKDSV